MKPSKQLDIDGKVFPDPLSISYHDIQYTQIPVKKTINAGNISKFWLLMHEIYGLTDHDDVLLNLNGIPHIGMLKPGDDIYIIDFTDLHNFNTQKRIGSELT